MTAANSRTTEYEAFDRRIEAATSYVEAVVPFAAAAAAEVTSI